MRMLEFNTGKTGKGSRSNNYIYVLLYSIAGLLNSLASCNNTLFLVRFHLDLNLDLQFDLHLGIHFHLGLNLDSINMYTHAKSYAHSHGMLRQRAGYVLYEL